MKTWRLLRGWLFLVVLAAGGWAVLHFVVLRKKPIEVRVARADRGRVERILTNTVVAHALPPRYHAGT